ncbi:tRNA sulfurtransferase [Haloferacaceae archaeon DSL9]
MYSEPDVVLVAYGEIGTKSSGVRSRMERLLQGNLQAMLDAREIDGTVEHEWSRLRIRTGDPESAARAAADTFGVVWAAPARRCEPTLDAICDALEACARGAPSGSIAVRARRAGEHDFSSRDVEREGGARVVASTGAPVDLDDPAVTYRVECRKEEAFVSTTREAGPGGLPLGSQEPVVALVSGGIDSPVAAWELMKRGSPVVPVYVDLGDYGGPDHRARAEATIRRLARYAPNFDLRPRVVPGGDLADALVADVSHTRMLSLRRAMVRVAEAVARDEGACAIATGEALGQKSSQTTANLAVSDAAVDLPILRPLLTRDKQEIVAKARGIGTYTDATLSVGCEQIAPTRPETNAALSAVEAAEPDELFDLAAAAATAREVVGPS